MITKYKEIPELIPRTVEKSIGDCEVGGRVYEFKTRENVFGVVKDADRYPKRNNV